MGSRPEKRSVFRGGGDLFRMPLATNVPVEANHPVRRRHDDVKIVTNHQNGASMFGANILNSLVKFGCTRLIEALRRLIKDQQMRV